MKIELRKLSDIKPYPGNPRHNDDAVDAVAALDAGVWLPPADRGGRRRRDHRAATRAARRRRSSAWKQVPVHVATDLTPEQIQGLPHRRQPDGVACRSGITTCCRSSLASCRRRTTTWACSASTRTSWRNCSIPACKDGLCDPDDVPAPPDEAITQPGDLWMLGDHRLLCGDSAKPEDVDRLLGGAAIHLCNTDPPYNVKVEPRQQQRHRRRPVSRSRERRITRSSTSRGIPRRRSRRRRSCGPRTGRWPTTSSPTASSTAARRLVRQHRPRARCRAAASTSGAATPTAATIRRC